MSDRDPVLTARTPDVEGRCRCGVTFKRPAGSKNPRLCTACSRAKEGLLPTCRRDRTDTLPTEIRVLKFLRGEER